ncbi:MAG: hypothetical protein AB7G11_14145 [Phycisphaerales bacterium]
MAASSERSAAPARLAGLQEDFARILGRARSAAPDNPEAARQAAEEFVSMSLVQPLLAQLRSTNHAAAPFAPSTGETQFRQMLDAQIAHDIVRAKQFPLVDAVARKLLSRSQGHETPERDPGRELDESRRPVVPAVARATGFADGPR